MNKFLLTVAISCSLMITANAQNKGVDFKHDAPFKEVLAEAKSQKKLIFFDAYTSWCGPCKVMATQVFTLDSIGDFFNQNFINVKYDMEKGEGIALKKQFKDDISGYPTFLFINGDGEIVHKIVGAASAKEFMPLVRQALNPSTQLAYLAKKYNAGDQSVSTVSAYLNALDYAGDYNTKVKVAQKYLDVLPPQDLIKPETWGLLSKYLKVFSSKSFQYVLNNKELFINAFGALPVNIYLSRTIQNEVNAVKTGKPVDKARQEHIINILANKPYEGSNRLYAQALLDKYQSDENWDEYCKEMEKVVYTNEVTKGADKISFSFSYIKSITEKAPASYLDRTISWIDELSKNDSNPNFLLDLIKYKKIVLEKQGKKELLAAVDSQIESLTKKADEYTNKGGIMMMKTH